MILLSHLYYFHYNLNTWSRPTFTAIYDNISKTNKSYLESCYIGTEKPNALRVHPHAIIIKKKTNNWKVW